MERYIRVQLNELGPERDPNNLVNKIMSFSGADEVFPSIEGEKISFRITGDYNLMDLFAEILSSGYTIIKDKIIRR